MLHEGLDVHVEAVAARTLGGLGGQLALLKQEGQQGKQGVSEHGIDQIMDNLWEFYQEQIESKKTTKFNIFFVSGLSKLNNLPKVK